MINRTVNNLLYIGFGYGFAVLVTNGISLLLACVIAFVVALVLNVFNSYLLPSGQ